MWRRDLMLTVEEARTRVLDAVELLNVEDVLISDALGCVLAHDQHAPHPLPRFANSAMDGFAVRGSDAEAASESSPVTLEVVGEVRAGDPGRVRVESGTAARIMTGGALPPGADAVVPIEEVEESATTVAVKAATPTGRHVRPAGDDVDAGELLVTAGTVLGPGEIALLAAMGVSPVPVRGAPRVAVL